MRILIGLYFVFFSISLLSQVTVVEKYTLDQQIEETSGLLFYNNKIITHNDSGDNPQLYELNASTGVIERTIVISNATHVDWEDIAMDDTHLYIGDIGNNNGDRTDLKIYKVALSDFTSQNTVTAEIINFSYADQQSFTSLPNATNFDAEALMDFGDSLLVFTKNWQDFQTKVYKIPKAPGTYSVSKVSTTNVSGLITGASKAESNNDFLFLCGYDASATPFLIAISDNRAAGDDIFNNGFTKVSLQDNPLGIGSQVEGIVSYAKNKIYLTREKVEQNVNGTPVVFEPKLYDVTEPYSSILSTTESLQDLVYFENPVRELLDIKTTRSINSIKVYSIEGKELLSSSSSNQLNVSGLSKGVYFLVLSMENNLVIQKKLLKE
ncbi:MAG: hypothetical protein CMB99_04875 [Flavobacteriaceae bacterium]|nr:hypothetical protein [Flavobacteriaceae bacterium]|tara:strand:+ start:130597 stop:131736 length:1140 start_codon:yes stop_codon:yes gene_type:complete